MTARALTKRLIAVRTLVRQADEHLMAVRGDRARAARAALALAHRQLTEIEDELKQLGKEGGTHDD